jgi:two-component system, chemotaxis family, protein-glutamate methylesterase/glutaminase
VVQRAPPWFDLIVVAGSVGGLEAVSEISAGLPADFPVPIAVVLHRSEQSPGILAAILGRRTSLRVRNAAAGDTPRAGTLYVAPPHRHLIVTPEGTFALQEGQLVHHTHSAADPLFFSAATVYRNRAICVVLSGGETDGAAGARAIGIAGGFVLAQDEATSRNFSMPSATIATGHVNAVLAAGDIADALLRLVLTRSVQR